MRKCENSREGGTKRHTRKRQKKRKYAMRGKLANVSDSALPDRKTQNEVRWWTVKAVLTDDDN